MTQKLGNGTESIDKPCPSSPQAYLPQDALERHRRIEFLEAIPFCHQANPRLVKSQAQNSMNTEGPVALRSKGHYISGPIERPRGHMHSLARSQARLHARTAHQDPNRRLTGEGSDTNGDGLRGLRELRSRAHR